MSYPFQHTSSQEYNEAVTTANENPDKFWGDVASHFYWHKRWDKVCEWNFTDPKIAWFKGGKLNITENCLDRHLETQGDQQALTWEPNNPSEKGRSFTYTQLHQQVCAAAQALRQKGIKKGDRVCLYMGMIPELTIAVLACARIGAVHSVIFGGFSAQSIADRVNDAEAVAIITCDGAFRGNKTISLKNTIDEALEQCSTVSHVIVVERTKEKISMVPERDFWWHTCLNDVNVLEAVTEPAEIMDAEDPLFILYTSGSTGKPKGVVHTCAGYMVYTTYSFVNVFQYQANQVYFCAADVGWITGHSYIIYGPLSAGAKNIMFEGIPTYPTVGRYWDIIDKYQVNIFYTAPTAIRSLMAHGEEVLKNYDLSSLKILGTVGEPINEEAWQWYYKHIGKKNCQIVDTWWQTETGGILISNLGGVTPQKPTFATKPLPGIQAILLDENGIEVTEPNTNGNLCIKHPWPGMIRTIYDDHERCRTTYFSTFKNYYFTGDGAYRDETGDYRITGRVDDVLNVSGHRIGTAEVENAINQHDKVIESAIVGYPHPIKGQGIYAYVITKNNASPKIKQEIIDTVKEQIGAIAKPDMIQFVSELPKTRSGKIMRRILRKIAEGEFSQLGDTSTLLNPAIVDDLINGVLQ
ncbi:MAG: acetyl-CoA synthetase [Saprospiraceae bacterium]|jgi:acetyl-CoA synthetase